MHKKTPKQVEKALKALLKKYGIQAKVSAEDVKEWIWNSTGVAKEASNKFQKKCLNLFQPFENFDQIYDVLDVFVDAWNFFPHKELDGKSPDEMHREVYGDEAGETSTKSKGKKEAMPKLRVGGREIEWDEFQMKMEKAQEPFKKWIEKDALPKYKKYLAQIVKVKKVCEEDYDVADVFFQRVLNVGFVELQDILPDFVRREFPNWWPMHVMHSDLRPAAVKKSLGKLFEFVELVYGVRI